MNEDATHLLRSSLLRSYTIRNENMLDRRLRSKGMRFGKLRWLVLGGGVAFLARALEWSRRAVVVVEVERNDASWSHWKGKGEMCCAQFGGGPRWQEWVGDQKKQLG